MLTDRQFESVLGAGFFLAGVVMDRAYLWIAAQRERKSATAILATELKSNQARLHDALAAAKEYPEKFGPDEAADRIVLACEREAFDECRRDILTLATNVQAATLAFYDSARAIPQALRDTSEFGGNIRSTLITDNISHLQSLAQKAIAALEKR